MQTIEVQYNEFQNWQTEIRVKHPNCEHEDTEHLLQGDREVDRALFCLVCGAIGMVQSPDEDGEIFIDWEHER